MSAIANSEFGPRIGGRRQLSAYDHGEPISRIDTLPLLLFVFVLVALFLSFQKPQTHALVVDLPMPFPVDVAFEAERSEYRIGIDAAGAVDINGVGVSDQHLPRLLASLDRESIGPRILFDPDPNTSYSRALSILAMVKVAGLVSPHFCFAGLERYRKFDKAWTRTPLLFTPRPPEENQIPSAPPTSVGIDPCSARY